MHMRTNRREIKETIEIGKTAEVVQLYTISISTNNITLTVLSNS